MTGAGVRAVARAAGDRLLGSKPGVFRALVAATVTGTATAALTYHVLRGTSEED